ncbi:ABC transporter substrate-binding protein, partial [Brevibacillus agri]
IFDLRKTVMGDNIFLLTNGSDETSVHQKQLTESPLWKTIPAVQQGRVYTLDSKFNFDDPITLYMLLDEIVQIMAGAGKADKK